VRARRALRISRRGSHRRAIRSKLGVVLCCRAIEWGGGGRGFGSSLGSLTYRP
jgi:hypothetical protein